MAEVKNAFIKSKMNKDLDARLLPNGEYREGINIQVSKSEGADVGALENVLGNNKLIDFSALTGVSNLFTVGLYTDEVNNNIYVFLTDYDDKTLTDSKGNNIYNKQLLNYSPTANNFVYVYNIATQEATQLLAGAFLNFSINYPIHSINLVENILFWTDNRNQPRKINITRAVADGRYYLTEDQISVAKYSPYEPIQLWQQSTHPDALPNSYETSMKNVTELFLPGGGSCQTDGVFDGSSPTNKIKNLKGISQKEGKNSEGIDETSGTLYYFSWDVEGRWHGEHLDLDIRENRPGGGFGIHSSSVRKAVLDLSGFSLRIGLRIKLF